jgi:hypothetical protein
MTLLKDLPVGTLVKDPNSKYLGKPIVWKIVARDHTDYPVDSTTLMSDKILSIKTYDAKEPGNSMAMRKTAGNNRWLHSNLRQWLNSDINAPWFSATHVADEPPSNGTNGNSYDNENGFLTNLGTSFKNAILETTLKTLTATADGGTVENVKDKIFLFSMTEMGLAGTTGKEGTRIPYLGSSGNRVLKPTQEAIDQSSYSASNLSTSVNYFYWMRSAYPDFPHMNYRITNTGAFAQSISDNDTIGIAPSVNLDSNAVISHQDTDGVYVLSFTQTNPTDLSGVVFNLKDTVSNKDITIGNKFSGTVKLGWNTDTANIGFTIKLTKDGTEIPYTKGQSLTDLGDYTAIITATDKAFTANKRESNPFTFSILPPKKNLTNLVIKNKLTGSTITNGAQFTGKVQPTWDLIDGVTISVTYSMGGVSKGGLVRDNTYTTPGIYEAVWLLTDDNYPENQLTGLLTFEVLNAPVEFPIDLKLKDALTGTAITNNSQFQEKVRPTWEEDDRVQYNVAMTFENSLISYSKGNTLTTIGKYIIKFDLVDKNYPANKSTITVPFEVIAKITDLNTYEMVFIDVNLPSFANAVINEGQTYKDEEVKPYWETLPTDCSVVTNIISRDTINLPFTPNTDVYADYGQYQIKVTIKNGAGDTREYTRNFEIVPENADLDIKIMNGLDNSEITEGRIYEEKLVKPTWIGLDGVEIIYNLKLNGIDYEFTKDITVLSEFGKYTLELVLIDLENPTNTKEINRNFTIAEKKVPMPDINLTVINSITGIPINNNEVYKGTQVKPYWYNNTIPENIGTESWITENGVRREYDKNDDLDILTEVGQYVLEIKLTDLNFPTNYKVITRNFSIIAESQDLTDKEIIIKNKLTDTEISEGEIFRGANVTVQPTWSEYPDLKYTYRLYFNGTVKTTYIKNNILSEKGNYRIMVSASDPNYPENKIETSVSFAIMDEIEEGGSGEGIEEAYLNGLPYKMGTPITKSGDYNLLVVRKKKTNFKVAMSEVNFMVVSPDEEQKPLIMIDPEFIPSIEDKITIRYPSYGTEFVYKIDGGEWKPYDEPFTVTDNCTIRARYRDPLGYYVEDVKDVTNIDKLPPAPPVILGVEDGDVRLTASPIAEFVWGVDFTATLDGQPYELGTPIFNEIPEIREYTLVVTAKKRLNGLTASTIIRFTLDSVPPKPPKIVGVIPNVIQLTARPDVNGYLEFFSYEDENDFEARLNGRLWTLGSLIDDPGSYQLSVTAIKKTNGLRATSIVVFTILKEIPAPIGPLRISLEPLTEENVAKAIDGELVVDLETSHISIYDDGYLISKTKELEEMLDILDKRIVTIDISLQNNETRIESLFVLKNNVNLELAKLQGRNFEVRNDINRMNSIINYLDFTDLSILKDFERQLLEIDEVTNAIEMRIDALNAKLGNKVELALQIMEGLQTNSSAIGEVIWLKNTQPLGRPKGVS